MNEIKSTTTEAITDAKTIANTLNNHFTNIGAQLA